MHTIFIIYLYVYMKMKGVESLLIAIFPSINALNIFFFSFCIFSLKNDNIQACQRTTVEQCSIKNLIDTLTSLLALFSNGLCPRLHIS